MSTDHSHPFLSTSSSSSSSSSPHSSSSAILQTVSKHRWRLLFFLCLLLTLSLILYLTRPFSPRRTGDPLGRGSSPHGTPGSAPQIPDNFDDEGEGAWEGVSSEELVRLLVRKYRVDFNAALPAGERRSVWEVAADWVQEGDVVPRRAPELGAILHAMSTFPIQSLDNNFQGTQLKLILTLSGGQKVVFKPKWYERDFIVEGPPFAGRDRHNGEVAAFHLSRVLDFRSTPLAVGRTIDPRNNIVPSAQGAFKDTFFEEDGELCFMGKCKSCDHQNALCTDESRFEGVVIMWLPKGVHLKEERNPFRQKFRAKLRARTESNDSYCSLVQTVDPFANNLYLLLEFIDTAVFDFMTGNADRHHFDTVPNDSGNGIIMLDNGKSFGNPYQDDRSILEALFQCCIIRRTTWQRLKLLGDKVLSNVMREVLRDDPLHPVLTEQHLHALDRRLEKVLHEIDNCIELKGERSVLLNSSP